MDYQENDLADDIVPDATPVHTEPPQNKFLPWHRVKKEYIRRLQWGDLTKRTVKRYWRELQRVATPWSLDETPEDEMEVQMTGAGQTLNCLVIPGQDLLDIRALLRDLQSLRCLIRYLGFNESEGSNQPGTRVHVANSELILRTDVANTSQVIRDPFEAIASTRSQAYRYLKEHGPFHVVNLDLCGSMFPNTVKSPQDYYNAIHRLLDYQFQTQTSEWLLFITTMVEPRVVHEDDLRVLCTSTRENFDAHSDFAEQIAGLFPPDALRAEGQTIDLSIINEDQMIRLFGVAFGKWLLKLCQTASPKWSIALRKSFSYPLEEGTGAVMLSLAFEFKRNITPPVDPSGISQLDSPVRVFHDERECAVKIAQAVGRIRDVDEELRANETLRNDLREAQADLLEAAGYDREAYLQWVAAGEVVEN